MLETLTIDRLGHRGDGIADGPDGPIYVPFAMPGERVRVERNGERARLLEVLEPSLERAAPPCRHFGQCGGCALQMMPIGTSRRLKRDMVVAALAQQGLSAHVSEPVGVDPASRRRAVLTARRSGKQVLLGFNERMTNRVLDIQECAILAPQLSERLAGLRGLMRPLLPEGKPARLTALVTSGGLDLDVEGIRPPSSRALPALVEEAQRCRVARFSVEGEPILTLAEPVLLVAGVALVPPPGAFVQASTEAEAIMAKLAAEHLAGCGRIADLFAGFGTFALALARTAPVRAVESSHAALHALAAAHRRATGLKQIETERRDLFAFPLTPAELNRFDGVVFDPPRAGAKAQAAALAASEVPRVAAISCNPASFARDARALVDGGYRLDRVVPVDQFVFSAETEVVGLFTRS